MTTKKPSKQDLERKPKQTTRAHAQAAAPTETPKELTDWRDETLQRFASRSPEDQEYILRTALLVDQLGIAFEILVDETRPDHEAFKQSFKPFIDQVWREVHRGYPGRMTAMAICRALDLCRDVDHALVQLKRSGYPRLAATLDRDALATARVAWFDKSPGRRVGGRISKYEHVARIVSAADLEIDAATIERLWRDNKGNGKRDKSGRRRPRSRPASSSPPMHFKKMGEDGIARP